MKIFKLFLMSAAIFICFSSYAQAAIMGEILSAETKTGSLVDEAQIDSFTFTGQKNQGIVILMSEESGSGTNFQPDILLLAPDGTVEKSTWANGAAHISDYQLEQTGTYTIAVMDAYGDDTGIYNLSFLLIGPTSTTTAISSTTSISSTTTSSIYQDCIINISSTPPEGGTTSPSGSIFLQGCSPSFMTVYAIPNPGYIFSHWEGTVAGTVNPINVPANGSVVAVFVKTYQPICFVKAIYGENSEQTELLRKYRDNVLSKTSQGQEIIKTYYKFSPTITKLLEQRPLLKNRVKAFIDSMLPGIRKKVEENENEP